MEKTQTRIKLINCALTSALEQFPVRLPGPHDDAEGELNDEHLLIAAREFVEAHADVKTIGG